MCKDLIEIIKYDVKNAGNSICIFNVYYVIQHHKLQESCSSMLLHNQGYVYPYCYLP